MSMPFIWKKAIKHKLSVPTARLVPCRDLHLHSCQNLSLVINYTRMKVKPGGG